MSQLKEIKKEKNTIYNLPEVKYKEAKKLSLILKAVLWETNTDLYNDKAIVAFH